MVLVLQQEHPTCVCSTRYAKALLFKDKQVSFVQHVALDLCAEGTQSCQNLSRDAELLLAWGRAPALTLMPPEVILCLKRNLWKQGCSQLSCCCLSVGARLTVAGRPCSCPHVPLCSCKAVRMVPLSDPSLFPVINPVIQLHLPATGGGLGDKLACLWDDRVPLHVMPCARAPAQAGAAFASSFVLPGLMSLQSCDSWCFLLLQSWEKIPPMFSLQSLAGWCCFIFPARPDSLSALLLFRSCPLLCLTLLSHPQALGAALEMGWKLQREFFLFFFWEYPNCALQEKEKVMYTLSPSCLIPALCSQYIEELF